MTLPPSRLEVSSGFRFRVFMWCVFSRGQFLEERFLKERLFCVFCWWDTVKLFDQTLGQMIHISSLLPELFF